MAQRTINGKVVEDGRRKIRLEIVDEDIKKADPRKPESCAAARALVRQTHAMGALVHLTRTYIEWYDCWQRFLTPDSLRTEIAALDRGGKMKPGIHLLRPPPPSQSAGMPHDTPDHRNKRKKVKKAVAPADRKRGNRYKLVGVRRAHVFDHKEGD